MAKTPEELAELKEKLDALKEEISALSEEELKQIAGGDAEADCAKLKCKNCGSTNLSKTEDLTTIYWKCKDCGYEWKEAKIIF